MMEKNPPERRQNEYTGKGKPKCRECNIALEKKEKVVCVFCVREGACPN